jgi:hypothetical protein
MMAKPRLLKDLTPEAMEQFNLGGGRYLAASLMLLNHALWVMPQNELRNEFKKVYSRYYSLLTAMGWLVPPMHTDWEDDICRVVIQPRS